MKVIKRLLLVLVGCFATSMPSQAQTPDVSNIEFLLRACKSSEGSAEHTFCLGFVSGIADMMEQVGLQGAGRFKPTWGMCVSKPFPTGNAEVQAFVNWAERNPKEWGRDYMIGVVVALRETWPCNPSP
jgi:hypothetical protein